MSMELVEHWCVLILDDDKPNSLDIYGPYDEPKSAWAWADFFNGEFDGSPWHATVRPMSLLRDTCKV